MAFAVHDVCQMPLLSFFHAGVTWALPSRIAFPGFSARTVSPALMVVATRPPGDPPPVEYTQLRRLPENERQARLASEAFRNRFTPAEQQMLDDLSGNLPLRPSEP